MRMYGPVWKELKEKGFCIVAAPPVLHNRIVKAVTKEKDRDVGFKLVCANINKVKQLRHVRNGAQLKFFLTDLVSFRNITAKDL